MSDSIRTDLEKLYTEKFGAAPTDVTALRADGSDRKIYRLSGNTGPRTVIGISGLDVEENRAFISYSRALRSAGRPVPEIHAVGAGERIYLEEDLGDQTLFSLLGEARRNEPNGAIPLEVVALYRQVVELLPRLQIEGGRVIDYSVAHPHAEFDRQSMMWDLNYFKYHFLKLAGIPFNEARLERDFLTLCDYLLQADRTHFLYRDFQSRNIMIRDGAIWFIDYQGGRRGALQYDIASLLYDAKADLNDDLRAGLLEHYLDALEKQIPVDRPGFTALYHGFVLIRIMQAMGAYGYRGYFQRKGHFLDSVPYAVRNIEGIIRRGAIPVELPELVSAFVQIIRNNEEGEGGGPSGFAGTQSSDAAEEGLPVVTVPSLIPTLIQPTQTEIPLSSLVTEPPLVSAPPMFVEPVIVEEIVVEKIVEQPAVPLTAETPTEDAAPVAPVTPVMVQPARTEARENESSSPQPSPTSSSTLTVRITSFSYRRGYPEERSENGGGFVFDCRALHNPGRYDEYRNLCGCDTPVVEFLEREEPVVHYWHAVVTLVDGAIENYLGRGFTDLSVSFGCTGGQHRSVYFSERLARHIAERYPQVVVELEHRERSRWPAAPSRSEVGAFESGFSVPGE